MPWLETAPMHQRTQFIADYQRHVASVVELCQRFGVSRKTGYKWIDRADRTAARTTRQTRSSRRCSTCAAVIPPGAPRSCYGFWRRVIRPGRSPRAARPAISCSGTGWSRIVGVASSPPTQVGRSPR